MFICITGLDGAGKTGLIEDLRTDFSGEVENIHLPHDPVIRQQLNLKNPTDPFLRSWRDRTLFAEDNRIASSLIGRFLLGGATVLSQRGWMDSFVHGSVVGYDCDEVNDIVRVQELVQPDASLYLTCNPSVAWSRVRDDPERDRWETPAYLEKQYYETHRFFELADRVLDGYFSEPRLMIDTSTKAREEVRDEARSWLMTIGVLSPDISIEMSSSA